MSEQEVLRLHSIISTLSSLQLRIQKSGLERTMGLYESLGGDCPYYRKSLHLFRRNDLKDLEQILTKVTKEIEFSALLAAPSERPENGS